MPLATQANLYCTRADVEQLLSALGVDARLDDDVSGVVSPAEELALTQAINWATATVKFFALIHYDDADLATSWLVNEWACILAAVRLCSRRLNPIPDSLKALAYGEDGKSGVYGDLREVRAKKAQIPDIGYRNVDWPAWSNVTVDPRYRLRQIRVQRPQSERTPTQYPQTISWEHEGVPEL